MYNQPYQPSFGQPVQSQYRGYQKPYRPTGFVQSFYQPQQQQQQPSFSSIQSQNQNYHTANYVGNQIDHDAYLREDSMSPSSSATRGQIPSSISSIQSQNYHTANYVGNQPDHDAYLREDSMNPSASAMRGQIPSSISRSQSQWQQSSPINQMSSSASSWQSSSPSNYHLQNYVGDRRDHDAFLREDSMRPSNSFAARPQAFSQMNQFQASTLNPMNQSSQFRNF